MPFLTALFDLNGTRTRKQALRVFLVLLVTIAVAFALQSFAPGWARLAHPAVGLAYVWWWATVVRRLHDAGHSGAWAILLALPLLGLLVGLAALVLRSDRHFNDSHAGLRVAGTVALVCVAILALSRAFWAPYWSPSESMKPTLLVGDYHITRYLGADSLARGDVVVFRHPVHGSTMVKRLIGLPGDRIEMRGGVPLLNGVALAQTAAGTLSEPFGPQGPSGIMPRCTNAVVGLGGRCDLALLRETLPDGRSYLVANIETAYADNTAEFTVPAGHLFFLGDNRDNSLDSRFAQGAGGMGFVPAENVVGRVTRVLFSAEGASLWAFWEWRGDRFFKAVE
jgi:signal peptidase I